MRKVLFFLGVFVDQDIDWIVGASSKEAVAAGTCLVNEGQPIDVVSIVINGRFAIEVGDTTIAEIGAGEMVGELSFLDAQPPSADVRALEDSIVLAISAARLASKLERDHGFASRFYRALGILLAYRLRDAMSLYDEAEASSLDDPNEMDLELLDQMSLAAVRFDRILEQALR